MFRAPIHFNTIFANPGPGDGCPLSTLRCDMSGAKPVQPVADPVGQIEPAKRRGSVLFADYNARSEVVAVAREANVTRPISHTYLRVIIRLENQ